MTATPPTLDRTRVRRDLLVVWATGLLISAALGWGAAMIREEQFWLVFGVFTACFLAPCITLAWLLLGAGRHVTPDPHVEENVESRWIDKAASGALFDTLSAAGITAGAIGLFELEVDAGLALMGVVAFALLDGWLRFTLLRRREA